MAAHAAESETESPANMAKVECVVYYLSDRDRVASFVGSKERMRLPVVELLKAGDSLPQIINTIIQFGGLAKEAGLRGLGESIHVRLYCLESLNSTTKAFAIQTSDQWMAEKGNILSGQLKLQGNFKTVYSRVLSSTRLGI